MIRKNINRIDKIEGTNIFVFQYIDANGNLSEEKKPLEDFLLLHPLVIEKEKRISDLESHIQTLIKASGLQDEKVIRQSQEIQSLENDKEQLKKELEGFLLQVEGKDLSQTTDLYQLAFQEFMNGNIDEALLVLDEAKLEEEERIAKESIKQKAETRLLKAKMLRIKHRYEEAGRNYEKAVELFLKLGQLFRSG